MSDPLKYSRYSNSGNSCFFAGLWALLHKPNNLIINKIKSYSSLEITKHLRTYYSNIHSKISVVQFGNDLQKFRNSLPNGWQENQNDTGELVSLLFQNYEIKYNIIPTHSKNENEVFKLNPENLTNVKFTLDYWYELNNNFIGIKTSSLNYDSQLSESILPGFQLKPGDIMEFDNINNQLIVTDQKERLDDVHTISLENLDTDGTQSYQKKIRQVIDKPEFFYVYLNRNVYNPVNGRNIRNNNKIPIVESYGPMELHSIVVHTGSADGGHYVCYFKNGLYWYLFDDIGASIRKIDNLDMDFIQSRWNFLVYFRSVIPQIVPTLPTLPTPSGSSSSSNFSKARANLIVSKYNLNPISTILLSSLILYLVSIQYSEDFNIQNKDLIWLIGGLAMIIYVLIDSDKSIEKTVSKFFTDLFNHLSSTHSGGFFNTPTNWEDFKNFVIQQVTYILTEWYNTTDKSKNSLEQIIEKFKSNNLIQQLELAQLVKSPEYTISLIKSNKTILSKLNVNQQIQLLRSLKWKVNMTPLGPILIDWDQWVKLLNPKEHQQINQFIESNPWVKYQIQSYIYNINMNYSNLLTSK